MPNNIERSAFRKHEYVGYGDDTWRIVRNRRRGPYAWRAFAVATGRTLYAPTLERLSTLIAV